MTSPSATRRPHTQTPFFNSLEAAQVLQPLRQQQPLPHEEDQRQHAHLSRAGRTLRGRVQPWAESSHTSPPWRWTTMSAQTIVCGEREPIRECVAQPRRQPTTRPRPVRTTTQGGRRQAAANRGSSTSSRPRVATHCLLQPLSQPSTTRRSIKLRGATVMPTHQDDQTQM